MLRKKPIANDILEAKQLRKNTKAVFQKAKSEYVISKLNERRDCPKKFWQDITMIIPNDRNNPNIKLLNEEGKVLSNDDINICFSTIGEEFVRHMCNPAKPIVETINQKCQDTFMNLEQLELNDVTLDQLMAEIVKIDIYKSSGLDNLSSRFIRDRQL